MKHLEKYQTEKHQHEFTDLPFHLHTTQPYLDYAAYIMERNGERLLIEQDLNYTNEFPCVVWPKNEHNLEDCILAYVPEEQLIRMQHIRPIQTSRLVGVEYYYKTAELLEAKGQIWAQLRKHKNKFTKNFEYRLTTKRPAQEQLDDFYFRWVTPKIKRSPTFEDNESFYNHCLENLKRLQIKALFLFVGDVLVGLTMGTAFDETRWAGLHTKADRKYPGASEFLYYERAKLFDTYDEFTVGDDALDPGLRRHKLSLNPCRDTALYYIVTE